jgi:hypothetical protein
MPDLAANVDNALDLLSLEASFNAHAQPNEGG